jgi:hypothetical protein
MAGMSTVPPARETPAIVPSPVVLSDDTRATPR